MINNIKQSIHPPYRFDKTNESHAAKRRQLVDFLVMAPISCVIFGVAIAETRFILLPLAIAIIPATLVIKGVFRLLKNKHKRYYRLVRQTVEQGDNVNSCYVVQTTVSTKTISELASDDVKWKNADEFSNKEEAEHFLDRHTEPKIISEKVISEVRKSLRRPTFLDSFMEMHNLTRLQLKPYFPVLILLAIVICFSLFFSVLLSLVNQDPSWVLFISLPLLMTTLAFYLFYTKMIRYHRLVKRTVTQGRYKKTSIFIQSFISRKELISIGDEKDRKWQDFYIKNTLWLDYEENPKNRFNEDTMEVKVFEEFV
ncbi:hypothetical protein [Fulvivirga ligni]|uniref:hypothetical protein n=1 Tax=Fulvivirga ligni TaxID=2904246 RepID=UPI001F4163DF|nr:hypothetical protein [Fulvivirga ligni]UII19119.1 hypothetical protein LVD16_14840 [Fulvivirga ligni]